ncbi:MAG: FAD-dependent oxidoreductase [Candidatus Doudnabacteria bacterium]|nr:FAD-dependent oxidoreductase [Candidatus Doudnabacteria bacterium]
MSLRFFTKVKSQQKVAADLVKLELVAPSNFSFLAGQFMSVAVEGFVRRSYSLANPPHEAEVLVTYVDTTPGGPGSRFMQQVAENHEIDLLAPLGHFIYIEEKFRPAYFFATGTGIVPFISMIRHELETVKSGRQVVLHYGVKQEDHLLEKALWERLTQEFPNFAVHFYVSRSTEWEGNKGRMTEFINQGIPADIDAYLCGGMQMIQDVEALLLAQGVHGGNIYYERFY